MHETGIIQEILNLAAEELERSGYSGKIVEIRMKVGRLSGVSIEALRFAFEAISPSSGFEDAVLVISESLPVCSCADCGESFEVDNFVFSCRECGSKNIDISGGRELHLDSLEIEE